MEKQTGFNLFSLKATVGWLAGSCHSASQHVQLTVIHTKGHWAQPKKQRCGSTEQGHVRGKGNREIKER